jgi:hypothetical protein
MPVINESVMTSGTNLVYAIAALALISPSTIVPSKIYVELIVPVSCEVAIELI